MMKKTKHVLMLLLVVVTLGGGIFWVLNTPALLAKFYTNKLSEHIIHDSLLKGKSHLFNSQTEAGNFVYLYDFSNDKVPPGRDSEVRQAGALWGVSIVSAYDPDTVSWQGVEKGIRFFDEKSGEVDQGRYAVYNENNHYGKTGTQCLFVLAYLEYVKSLTDSARLAYHSERLADYSRFLLSLQQPDYHFYGLYSIKDGSGLGKPSPYSDGEALLALLKVTRYFQVDSLQQRLMTTAQRLYDDHVTKALGADGDSPTTKGFYQWGSMSFYEIFDAGWDNTFANKSIYLAHWMIDTHRTLWRTKNTAYQRFRF